MMDIQYIWFPTQGRMRRRIIKNMSNGGLAFRGQLFGIWGMFRCGLVYEKGAS